MTFVFVLNPKDNKNKVTYERIPKKKNPQKTTFFVIILVQQAIVMFYMNAVENVTF